MKKKILFLLILCECFIFSSRAQMPLPNIPNVFLDSAGTTAGIISSFEHDSATNKLYIAGEFERVGTALRMGFAVIDMSTGNVLNDLDSIMLIPVNNLVRVQAKLKIFKGSIYVGGLFTSDLYGTGVSPGSLFSVPLNGNTMSVRSLYSPFISDFEIYNSKIYTSGAYYQGQPVEYEVNEMDTLGNISWTQSISTSVNHKLSCVFAKNNFLYVGGIFTSFGGVSLKNVAKVNLATHTISTWQPIPLPGPSASPACFEVKDMAQFSNDLYLDIGATTCSNPSKNVIAYDLTTGNINPAIQSVSFNGTGGAIVAETDTSYWYSNGSGMKLYGLKNYIGSWWPIANAGIAAYFRKAGYLFVGGSFDILQGAAHKGIGVYCAKPATPLAYSTYTAICQGSVSWYNIHPIKDVNSYHWNYTGTGLTITGSSTLVWLNFSNTATSGTLKISATSYCGTTSDTLYKPFTVNIKPNVTAGPDIRFTCSHNVDTLKGSSSTPGVTYSWTGPVYTSTSPQNQVTNTIAGGNYVLAVTTTAGCQNKDTAIVIFDTAAPSINHNLSHGGLSCSITSVVMNATPLYPTASLHWSGSSSFSQSDPATVTAPGIYTVTITSNINDCINKDTFLVKSNTVLPNISAPATLDTITCVHDSVLLTANSTTANTILYWTSVSDTLPNNSYTHNGETYSAHALDTVNGCSSQLIRPVAQYITQPVVVVPAGNFNVNCSFSSVTLDGSTPNPGATLLWSGPNSFISTDPITVSQAGTYVLTATNPQNGCTAKDSLDVTLQHILVVHACTDTLICNGSSAILTASPVGGTPGFTYSWSGTTATGNSVNVSPTDTTDYIVTITDQAGCIGSDTARVMVPVPVGDSANTFQPCDPNNPNGQIQAYGTGGIPPYNFALNSGSFQSTGIFAGLNFGTYNITVRDTLGCLATFSAVIDTSSILPAPDFLLSTTEIKGDTFVIVDISNPRPDSVHWILPTNCSIVNTDPFAPQIIHADTGAFQITMMAWFGDCQMQITKNVTVLWPDTNTANGHYNNGISDLTLYPNPNTGQFTVDITLYKKQAVAIFIFDGIGNEILRLPYSNTDHVSANVQMNNPAPGSYILKVITEYDSRTKTFLISQP